MFPPIMTETSRFNDKCVYIRPLGWKEYDDDGDCVPALMIVVDAQIGYNIFRVGQELCHLDWYYRREDAIEYAVDRTRWEIAQHEVQQAERE